MKHFTQFVHNNTLEVFLKITVHCKKKAHFLSNREGGRRGRICKIRNFWPFLSQCKKIVFCPRKFKLLIGKNIFDLWAEIQGLRQIREKGADIIVFFFNESLSYLIYWELQIMWGDFHNDNVLDINWWCVCAEELKKRNSTIRQLCCR